MKYKCTLFIDEKTIDATYDIRNWDEIQVSFKREDYGGVVRSFTNKFQFVGVSRLALLEKFSSDYLTSSAKITIYTKNASWGYDERFSCGMDFASLSDDGNTLSMNALDNDVAAIIKAKKGVEYEYISSLISNNTLLYDRIMIKNQTVWSWVAGVDENVVNEIGGTIDDYSSASKFDFSYHIPPLYITSSEIGIKSLVEVYDAQEVSLGTENWNQAQSIFKFLGNNITPSISINITLDFSGLNYKWVEEPTQSRGFELYKRTKEGQTEYLGMANIQKMYLSLNNVILNDGDEVFIVLNVGEDVYFYTYASNPTKPSLSISFNAKGYPILIDAITPINLLNRILKSMNDENDDIIGEIENNEKLNLTMICPAESIRGIPGAKIYTSFTKFCEWMEAVFGYIYEIQDRKVIFKHRASLFSHDVVKEVDRYNGYGLSIDNSLVFSQVNIGYEKQDYESVNGRDEFNFTNQYSTGVLNTESKLELISPYRADCYGIEFLAQKRGEDTTDNESDKDVFFIGVVYDSEKGIYSIDRSKDVQNVASPDTIFNAMYSPSQMAEENKYYIGACTSKLTFASSDGNSDAIIGGEAENRDIDIDLKLFSAKVVQFETSDIAIPSDLNGTVLLHYKGGDIRGFLMEADYTYTKTQSSKIKLLVE